MGLGSEVRALSPPQVKEPTSEWQRDQTGVPEVQAGWGERSENASAALARRRLARLDPAAMAAVARAAGPVDGPRVAARVAEAARHLDRERVTEAVRILRPVAQRFGDIAVVRELLGCALYRQGRWAEAIRNLETYAQLSGSVHRHPILADCYRALGRSARVEELWEELKAVSPAPEIVAEGRIVVAGGRADRGDLAGALRLLQAGPGPRSGRTHPHHLRQWYAIADLYERSGDVARAREMFNRVAAIDPAMADVAERVASLTR
ncbi:MAG: tetratricopeptide repeat protein [Acidimicrobiales bacterium]